MSTIFHAAGWKSILHSGADLVAAEKPEGKGAWYVCQLKLIGARPAIRWPRCLRGG